MTKVGEQSIAVLLNQEVSAVVTAMRQNFRWAMVPTRYTRAQDEENGDEPLLEEFKLLRRRIFHYHDWSVVDPMEYLRPFLEVILSQDTSGQITGTALTSVARFLDYYILGAYKGSLDMVMRRIADAVTQCKFESSNAASDNVVLYKILQVLAACLKCPGGRSLTDDNLINIFHACYRIGHHENDPGDRSSGGKDLLKAASRQVTIDLVALLFSQLESLSDTPPLNSPKSLVEDTKKNPLDQNHTNEPTDRPVLQVPGQNGRADDSSPGQEQVLDSMSSFDSDKVRQEVAYGLKSVHEVLSFIISLINNVDDPAHRDMASFGLELMYIALSQGRSEFAKHEDLMELLREDVWQALYQAVSKAPQLGNFVSAGQVALCLWLYLGQHLLLQLEAFMKIFLLWLTKGSRASATQYQEASLEIILDLCSQNNFIRTIFVNLDCRVERSDLFESICGHLSKTALPVNNPLGSIHINSLEGLFSVLQSLSRGCVGMASWEGMDDSFSNTEIAAIWEAYCDDKPAPLVSRRLKTIGPTEGELDSPHSRAKAKADEERKIAIETALLEKVLKSRLATATEHFNLDAKKAFLYLQSIGLLEEKLKARPVARFLRKCPGLSKQTIGELLGEHSNFYLEVLDEFTKTFNFKGMSFDNAIRSFLESFRLPGEAQKINRIVESFGTYYHMQCPKLFKNADAVYIFAYSVILLNTDQHNHQVKRKMTCEDFIKNNRGINDGENLPEDFLRSLYQSISGNEIKISADASSSFGPIIWEQIAVESLSQRAQVLDVSDLATPSLDRHIFALMWQPTIAAVSVVLDHADDPQTVQHALDGLLLAARLAAFHRVDEVMDNMVASLSKFAAVLDPVNSKAALTFGENEKARRATHTMFTIANRYGDSLRTGWKQLLQCIIHLFQLDLLPPDVLTLELDDQSKERLPRPSARRSQASGASLLTRAFSSLISIDVNESAETRPREAAASKNTAECIESCHIKDVFVDSKFLRAESLIELVKALMWASGPVNRIAASGENSDVAEVGLELVIVVALRNRDRLMLIWPLVHDMLSTILAPEHARDANSLVRRATTGLLRVCRRLLHYKAESAGSLLKSLQMVQKLNPEVAWKMASDIAAEILLLVENAGESLREASAWSTITRLIISTQLSADARETSLKALLLIAKNPTLCPVGFLPCLEATAAFLEKSNDGKPEIGIEAIKALQNMFQWLCIYDQQRQTMEANTPKANSGGTNPSNLDTPVSFSIQDIQQIAEPSVPQLWRSLVILLYRASTSPLPHIRDRCLEEFGRILTSSGELNLPPQLWLETLQDQLLPLTHEFATKLAAVKRDNGLWGPRFSLALKLLSKVILQLLPVIKGLPNFPDLWAAVLQEFQDLTRLKNEEVGEAVPETLKNMLLVMDARKTLVPEWQDGAGNNLWDLTWHKAQVVSSGLTPSSLGLVPEKPNLPETSSSNPPTPHSTNQPSPEISSRNEIPVSKESPTQNQAHNLGQLDSGDSGKAQSQGKETGDMAVQSNSSPSHIRENSESLGENESRIIVGEKEEGIVEAPPPPSELNGLNPPSNPLAPLSPPQNLAEREILDSVSEILPPTTSQRPEGQSQPEGIAEVDQRTETNLSENEGEGIVRTEALVEEAISGNEKQIETGNEPSIPSNSRQEPEAPAQEKEENGEGTENEAGISACKQS